MKHEIFFYSMQQFQLQFKAKKNRNYMIYKT